MFQVVLESRWEQDSQPSAKLRDGRVPGMSAVEELRSLWLQHGDMEKEGGEKEGVDSF